MVLPEPNDELEPSTDPAWRIRYEVRPREWVIEHFESRKAARSRALSLWPDDRPRGSAGHGKPIYTLYIEYYVAALDDWKTYDSWLP